MDAIRERVYAIVYAHPDYTTRELAMFCNDIPIDDLIRCLKGLEHADGLVKHRRSDARRKGGVKLMTWSIVPGSPTPKVPPQVTIRRDWTGARREEEQLRQMGRDPLTGEKRNE